LTIYADGEAAGDAAGLEIAVGGSFCRGVYRSLTIKDELSVAETLMPRGCDGA
jgi:hypothetical protein